MAESDPARPEEPPMPIDPAHLRTVLRWLRERDPRTGEHPLVILNRRENVLIHTMDHEMAGMLAEQIPHFGYQAERGTPHGDVQQLRISGFRPVLTEPEKGEASTKTTTCPVCGTRFAVPEDSGGALVDCCACPALLEVDFRWRPGRHSPTRPLWVQHDLSLTLRRRLP